MAETEGPEPDETASARLEVALEAWTTICNAEGPDLARMWLTGLNPLLDEIPPIVAIRADRHEAVIACAAAMIEDPVWS